MSLTRGLPPERLHPAGKQVLAGMPAKGWIEKQADGRTYCITKAGMRSAEGDYPNEAVTPNHAVLILRSALLRASLKDGHGLAWFETALRASSP